MNSITADWKIWKGNYYSKSISVTNKRTGKPLDITSYKFYFTLKTDVTVVDGSATLQKTWTSHTSPTEGLTSFELTVAETNAIAAGQYIYGMSYLDTSSPDKKKYTFLTGNIEVQVDPTLSVT